eukprot:scaffold2804_cov181-Amphora_coffeaeformis.AAC.2
MKSKKKNRQQRAKKPPPNFSVDDLTEAAAVAFANQEVDTALALYTSALDTQSKILEPLDPTKRAPLIEQRIGLLEKRAETKTTLGDPDGAREDYQQALELHKSTETLQSDPSWYERSASLHLYIGQTSTGREAIAVYEQALSILESLQAQCGQISEKNAVADVTQQLSAVCCNAAEVYLTDLCEEPDAEEQCEMWVQKALSYKVPSSESPDKKQPTVDALQLLANLRISQCRAPEALPAILEAYRQIEIPCRSLARLVDISSTADSEPAMEDRAKELSHIDAVQSLPGFEFRCQMVKIMLEAAAVSDSADISERTACQHAAISVLGSLMAENDEVIEVWALLGDAFAAIASNEEASSYYQSALDMLSQLKQSIEDDMQMSTSMEEDDDDADQIEDEMQQQLDDVMCQIDEVRRKISEVERAATGEPIPMQE